MQFLKRMFSGFDPWLLLGVGVLLVLGMVAIASSSAAHGGRYLLTQSIAIVLGAVLMMVAASAHSRTIHRLRYAVVLATLLVLVAVLVIGRTVHGTRGWFLLGPVTFQPIEFAKVALIILLAAILPLHARLRSFSAMIGSALVTAILVALTLAQPDLGSAAVLLALWSAMLLVSGVPRRQIIILFVAAVAVGALAWNFALHDYQRDRVLTFIDPSRDPQGRGYNVSQAQIAVGSGGLWGAGFASGTQSQLRFLPESQTDFVFSLIAEELGLVAVTVILAAFALIFWRLARLVGRAPDDFTQFIVIGTASLIAIESFIAIGGNIGLVPMTGITLPFVSAGGSSILAHLTLIGLVEGVARAASHSAASRG